MFRKGIWKANTNFREYSRKQYKIGKTKIYRKPAPPESISRHKSMGHMESPSNPSKRGGTQNKEKNEQKKQVPSIIKVAFREESNNICFDNRLYRNNVIVIKIYTSHC